LRLKLEFLLTIKLIKITVLIIDKMESEEFNSIYMKSWTILYQKFNKKYEIVYNNINIKSNFELFKQFTMNIDTKDINQV
jgi:hypothetical protein